MACGRSKPFTRECEGGEVGGNVRIAATLRC